MKFDNSLTSNYDIFFREKSKKIADVWPLAKENVKRAAISMKTAGIAFFFIVVLTRKEKIFNGSDY